MERYKSTNGLLKTTILILFLSPVTFFAQEEGYFTITLKMLTDLNSISEQTNLDNTSAKIAPLFFTESADVELTPKGDFETEIPSYYRHHQTLSNSFTGYVIELLQSDEKLKLNFPLFEQFGSVYTHQLKNGKYSYCIIANFSKPKSLKTFVNEVIIPHAPKATALKYKRGKRKKM